jgi:hypothetical protein
MPRGANTKRSLSAVKERCDRVAEKLNEAEFGGHSSFRRDDSAI